MGQKLEKEEGLSILGTRTRKELVHYISIGIPTQKSRTTKRILGPQYPNNE